MRVAAEVLEHLRQAVAGRGKAVGADADPCEERDERQVAIRGLLAGVPRPAERQRFQSFQPGCRLLLFHKYGGSVYLIGREDYRLYGRQRSMAVNVAWPSRPCVERASRPFRPAYETSPSFAGPHGRDGRGTHGQDARATHGQDAHATHGRDARATNEAPLSSGR